MKNTNAHDGRGMRDYKNKFFQTLSEKLSQEIPEVSLAALSLELSKVSELKIQPQLIDKILSEIIANGVSKNPLTITKEFVTLYRTYMHSEPHKTPDKQLKNYEKEIAGNFAEFQTTLLEATDTYTAKEFDFPSEAVLGSGSGKFRLYDKTIPSYMKKYAKKWNAKVYDDLIETDRVISERVTLPGTNKIPVTILELSDGMKKDVVSSSQPLFEIFGTVSLSSWAAKEVSDNMQNNIISQTTENMY